MKLFTTAIEKALRKAGPDSNTAICKFFGGNLTWVVFGSEVMFDDEILYSIADIGHGHVEWGTVLRSELESLVNVHPIWLQRDRYFTGAGECGRYFFDYFRDNGTLAGC
jgi:hypothetical protein